MYIQKIIFIHLLTLIIPCGGNYTGNEEEMVNSVSFELHPFLAVGHTGIIYTSRKGTLWHRISSGTVKNLNDVTYGKSKYIIVGSEGTMLISSDRTSWEYKKFGHHLYSIIFENDTFVVATEHGILTSSDGNSWIKRISGYSFNDVAYGNNTFVSLGDGGTIFISSDKSTWTERNSGTSNHLKGISFGNNIFVALGDGGKIITSSDGITWTSRNSGTTEHLRGITYANSIFIIVGENG